jgi:hypothetical protein
MPPAVLNIFTRTISSCVCILLKSHSEILPLFIFEVLMILYLSTTKPLPKNSQNFSKGRNSIIILFIGAATAQSVKWLGCRTDFQGFRARLPAGARDVSLQIGSGTHPDYYSVGNRRFFPERKAASEADHSPRSSTRVKNAFITCAERPSHLQSLLWHKTAFCPSAIN